MSIRLMTQVFGSDATKGRHRLVLLALADNANDEGICWPSQATIGRKANLSRQSVNKTVRELVEMGEISIKKLDYKTYYIVHPTSSSSQKTSSTDPEQGVSTHIDRGCQPVLTDPEQGVSTHIDRGCQPVLTGGVNPCLHESSLTINEPSHAEADASARVLLEQSEQSARPGYSGQSERQLIFDESMGLYFHLEDGFPVYHLQEQQQLAAQAISEWELAGEGQAVRNPSALQALRRHELGRKEGRNSVDLSWLDEAGRPLAEAFVAASAIVPQKYEHSLWRKVLCQWRDLGFTPALVGNAVAKMRAQGLTIAGPQSVTSIARSMMAEWTR